jgi:hypothetical protein
MTLTRPCFEKNAADTSRHIVTFGDFGLAGVLPEPAWNSNRPGRGHAAERLLTNVGKTMTHRNPLSSASARRLPLLRTGLPRKGPDVESRHRRSEEVRHQGGGPTDIGGIRLSKLRAHPLLLHAELCPEHEEDEDDNDEPAHLGDGDREAQKSGQNASVDGWRTTAYGPVVISS